MAKLYIVDVNSLNEDSINLLSDYRISKMNNYVFNKDKKMCIGAGIALNNGLKEYNLKEKDIEYEFSKYGKPYIKNNKEIYFNISHSSKLAICAISNKEVGCDIEKITKYNEKVVKRCFSLKEIEYINNSLNKDEAFTKIRTYKESFLKTIGIGINDKMNEFSTVPKNKDIIIEQNINNKKYKLKEYRKEDYIISVCEEVD